MILEELIYKRFTESEELIKLLARFSGRPAVFSPEAPEDNMSGWENKKQYPRLIYRQTKKEAVPVHYPLRYCVRTHKT